MLSNHDILEIILNCDRVPLHRKNGENDKKKVPAMGKYKEFGNVVKTQGIFIKTQGK